MKKTLILVHGRHFKPGRLALRNNWIKAICFGLERDFGPDAASLFRSIKPRFVYYGEISNGYLNAVGQEYNAKEDQQDRLACLDKLRQYAALEFNQFEYQKVPGITNKPESIARWISGPLRLLTLGDELIGHVARDLGEYWTSSRSTLGSDIRRKLTKPLVSALKRRDDIMLLSHSLGTVVSYDVLWKLSHYGEYAHLKDRKINQWITLGCPLGDANVRTKLKGSWHGNEEKRYPWNIRHWQNFSAVDDFICHDKTLEDDYRDMLEMRLITSIKDHQLFNLSERMGKSNPHHGTGYLIHPLVINSIHQWLHS